MKRSLILLLILLVIAIVAGAGYWGYQSSKPTLATIQTPPTIPVARSDVTQVVSAPGILVATRDVTLSLSIGGRISKLSVRSGNHVKAGDTLMLLDDKDLRYTLQTAQADLTAAQSAYDAAVARNAHSGDQIIVDENAARQTENCFADRTDRLRFSRVA